MLAGKFSVYINACLIVHRTKVENYSFVAAVEIKAFFVPYAIHKISVPNAGKLAFGAERDIDFVGQLGVPAVEFLFCSDHCVVDFELPAAV